MLRLVS